MAIPQQLVRRTSFLWKEEVLPPIHPLYHRNQLSGYLEGMRRAGSIFSDRPFNENARKVIIEDHNIRVNSDTVLSRYTHEEEIPEGSFQFSHNPEIPLKEYVERYEKLPVDFEIFKVAFTKVPDRVYEYTPRTEREAIFILEIDDDLLLDIVLEALREEQPADESDDSDDEEEPFIKIITKCPKHPDEVLGGWDSTLTYFEVLYENCALCNMYFDYFRDRIEKEANSNVDLRRLYEESMADTAQKITFYIETYRPDLVEDLTPLFGGNDIFDDDLEEDGGTTLSMFGTQDADY
jgi:hypothetical protein